MYLERADYYICFNREEIERIAFSLTASILKRAEQEILSFSGSFEEFVTHITEEESIRYELAKRLYGIADICHFETSIRLSLSNIYKKEGEDGA